MFHSIKTNGIIIKHFKYGEADRVLTIFTEDLGKIQIMAKGIRRGKSKLGGVLELFNLVSVEIIRGKTWDIVTSAQILNPFLNLKSDFTRMTWAHFFAEFTESFVEERAPEATLYRILRGAFLHLNEEEEYLEKLIDDEWRLLRNLGIAPKENFFREADLKQKAVLIAKFLSSHFAQKCKTLRFLEE